MLISKSKFVAGVQCLKRLYLIVHEPELAARPDESGQAIIDQGQEVGLLAQQMFPCRVAVESRDREQAIRATRELIENPEIPDRKSTRLNSSHQIISYAVFCLKKKR